LAFHRKAEKVNLLQSQHILIAEGGIAGMEYRYPRPSARRYTPKQDRQIRRPTG
jgi:hypothetical protein